MGRLVFLLLGLALAAPASVFAQAGLFGDVPLVTAARNGDLAEVRKQLLLGANVNRAEWGERTTALMQAAVGGRADIAVALLRVGAWTDIRDRNGSTALIWAADKGHSLVATLLVDAGADINIADNQGMTALMKAAMSGRHKMVNVLIALGADVKLSDYAGMSALSWAQRRRHWRIVRRLHRAGAKIQRSAN